MTAAEQPPSAAPAPARSVVQLVVAPDLWPALRTWLATVGYVAEPIPDLAPHCPPTYVTQPGTDLLARLALSRGTSTSGDAPDGAASAEAPLPVELRVGASEPHQIGVLQWPEALPGLLRAVADQIDEQQGSSSLPPI